MQTTISSSVGFGKAPWNKGRLIGQKRPLKPKMCGQFGSGFSLRAGSATSPCSISRRWKFDCARGVRSGSAKRPLSSYGRRRRCSSRGRLNPRTAVAQPWRPSRRKMLVWTAPDGIDVPE